MLESRHVDANHLLEMYGNISFMLYGILNFSPASLCPVSLYSLCHYRVEYIVGTKNERKTNLCVEKNASLND